MRWVRLVALLLVVGIILSPLRAMAATVSVPIAYDASVGLAPTTIRAKHDAVRAEGDGPPLNDYDCDTAAVFGYDDPRNPHMIASAGAGSAYDGDLEHSDRCELHGAGAIHDASLAPTAAGGVAAAARLSAAEAETIASRIASGHCFGKHVIRRG